MARDELPMPIEHTPSSKKIGVVIVTHDSQATIDQTLFALNQQTLKAEQVFLVDSGSSRTAYLKSHDHEGALEMCFMPNIGFSAGNNLGYNSLSSDMEFVLFLNPDVILPPTFLEEAVRWMEGKGRDKVGALTGLLLGWNVEKEQATGLVDSTGIFSTWYGKWYDRGRGLSVKLNPYKKEETVTALCGALMFCRKEALEKAKIGRFQVFDEKFFCYKEDIDLSLRIKKVGYSLYYVPTLIAYHVRGWNPHRNNIPRERRLMSAKNELILHSKSYNPIRIAYSALKWLGVKVFDL